MCRRFRLAASSKKLWIEVNFNNVVIKKRTDEILDHFTDFLSSSTQRLDFSMWTKLKNDQLSVNNFI